MRLYHGSPRKLDTLIPNAEFKGKKAIFLTRSFKQAALYAISKSLKGKTVFALPPGKVIIVEKNGRKLKPKAGYVYEVDVKAKKGPIRGYEYVFLEPIKDFRVARVLPKDYEKDIVYVKTKKELDDFLVNFK